VLTLNGPICDACRALVTDRACVELNDGINPPPPTLAYTTPRTERFDLCPGCSTLVLGKLATRLDIVHQIKALLAIREIQAEKAQARAEAATCSS
jgi:hypothetical protein